MQLDVEFVDTYIELHITYFRVVICNVRGGGYNQTNFMMKNQSGYRRTYS